MSRDVFLEGEAAGASHVKKWLTRIYVAKSSEEIGTIAGEALFAFLANEKNLVRHTFSQTDSFRQGFWQGFFDRAQEFRGNRQ